jgi:opacity protein-like surface antigen
MKSNLLLFCLLLISFTGFSQEAAKKEDAPRTGGLFLDGSLGVSLPTGSFAGDDVKSSSSGFATTGFAAQLNFDWIGNNHFGLGLQYTFQNNPLKSSVSNDTLSGMSQALGTGSWSSHYLMAGVSYLTFIHRFYIEGRGLIGFVASSSPVFRTTDPATQSSSTNWGIGLAYGIQLGAGYAISPRVTVKASIEYLAGTPKIHHQYGAQVVEIDSVTGQFIYSAPVTVETKRTLSAFLVKAGVVLKLSK